MRKIGLAVVIFVLAAFSGGCAESKIDRIVDDKIEQTIEKTMQQMFGDNQDYESNNVKRIEVYDLRQDEKQLGTVTDNDEIIDFLVSVYSEIDIDMDRLPQGVEPLYRFDFWQETTKQLLNPSTKLYRASCETLYMDQDGNYYLQTELDDTYMPDEMTEYLNMNTHISKEAVEVMLRLAESLE